MADKPCNGWKNWETWNASLFIFNTEELYRVAVRYRNSRTPYESTRRALSRIGITHTDDGLSFNNRKISRRELNAAIREA